MFAQLTRRFTHPGLAFALLGAMLVTAAPARAQAPTGTILGIVKDAQGAVVPGATVTATNLGTQYSRSAVTDVAGEYALRLLPVGNYEVTVNLEGFKNFTQTGIVLEVGRNARVDAALALGAVSETLTVVGDSPLVDTASSSLSRTVGQNEVLNLPLVNRDLYTLLNLTGGVSDNTNSNSLGGPEQLTTINGSGKAQMGTVNFQLDGGNNTAGLRGTGNPAPNPEAVQEFRVLTNGYAAEYGRYSAGVVDVVTKSGTNVLHGAGFDFFRNEKLNSPRWAPPGTTGTKDPLSRKQYGGAIGGPIAKDKMFFFASYSGLRQEETYYRNTAVVPTARERAGDFSLSSIKPRDPVTGVAFPGDLIPAARFDIAAKTILDRFVPMSNLPNNFFEVRAPDPIQTDEGTFKLDRQFSSTQSLAVSYFYQKGVDTQPLTGTGNIPWVDRDFRWKQHNVNASHTWTMSPTTINQFRTTYVRQFGGRVNSPAMSLGDLNSKFTIQGDPTLPRLTVTGYFTGQTAIAGPDAGSNYVGVKDAVSITKGKHALKLGGDVSYEKIIHDTLLDNYGVFTFNASKTGNAFADFLLGLPATMTQDAPVRKTDNGAYLSAFAQDDFRILPRVTLNLGVRYDVQFPFTDPQDRKLAFVPGQQSKINPSAPLGLLFPGDEGVSRGIVHTDVNNIAPRLGFAWDPTGNGRTAVRAAFGMFYGSITGNEWNTTADNQPFTVRQSFPTVFTLSDPYRNLPGGVGPFPFVYTPGSPRFTLPAQVFGPSLDFVWPVSYQTNITVEREIGRSFSTSASFVVSNARHLAAGVDNNYPVLTPTATTANVNTRRPYLPGTIGQATVLSSIFSSDYKGLQLSAERRGSRWSGKAYYSFGRGYDDVDFQGGGLPGVQNATRLSDERARTSSDRTHMFSLSGVWRIDYAKNASTVVRALASDWTVSAIVILQSGQPFTIASGQDRNLDGLTNDRADLVGDPSVDHSQSRDVLIEGWFNVAAFAQPALGTNGNSGRNIINGPGYKNVDFGLFRDVRLKGRTAVQFRLEATNLFNIVNLNNPGTSLAAPATFGKIRSARAMRQIQLGARVSF